MEMKSTQKWFMPALLFILSYEWIVSSVNKLVAPNYLKGVQDQMSQAESGVQFHPYATLLKSVGLHHAELFASLVLVGEMFVGLTFVMMGILMLKNVVDGPMFNLGGIAAVVAAFMSLNYALLGGDTLFIDPSNAFQQGISIDWLMFAIEVSLSVLWFRSARGITSTHRNHSGSASSASIM
ncbi:hypothetical protein [Alicyclobacillus dauci]|uniref:Thiosulfate dehydrogenase [quinone] large subunit n=1 Tax=Alicyclobacillus dauci TaxID=1475485 RepID=A0ABY6Z4Q1_9BACL|nr:hypothetical protein [Alicyclobacillus dauci]WAH37749.1 hypothetical protein NZD86_04395 [Alicyclobacillus dauci]